MSAGRIGDPSSRPFADEQFAEALHGMSQPLTTLECGLELAIRHDITLAGTLVLSNRFTITCDSNHSHSLNDLA